MSDCFRVFVRGVPQPQGSKRAFIKGGRAVITEANPRSRPWREMLRTAISEQWNGPPWDGAVELTMTFCFVRPTTGAGKKRPWPSVRPDAAKLQRTVEDALQLAGALTEDSRIVSWCGQKVYRGEPGVEIELRKLYEG